MIKALIFDVFGTCVDWRGSVARAVAGALPGVDAPAFADAWRAEYDPAMARIREGGRGYIALDDLHLENLFRVCDRFHATCADPETLNRAWERLDPWPDVAPGLRALKTHRIIAPCSNGSIALMTRLARHAGLPWDCILGADIARDYKPKPAVYLASCAALRLPPAQVMMVAAHNGDLHAARAAGLGTAFVPRPTEHGPGQTSDLTQEADWDLIAPDFNVLARLLNA
ncbi:haloacid dehalogenase [Defluviimonas sp. 20V17]|uniref:(S)-2-haloacid dehalogenase n=1 Tax=Allgaiera indica TaxID=765699 RepID=A0AAN4UTX2_9RHOB|nr:haloacid dehalogenase type II [Allgaiera indica]KDB05502.1 haloacid dehalogenase [Defluviimonas sp. 20V17]GHE04731.1 dehalogenase [Allgaiera indica]SDX46563.1 2-haloacid dehalogenase [Allgaiera indica]